MLTLTITQHILIFHIYSNLILFRQTFEQKNPTENHTSHICFAHPLETLIPNMYTYSFICKVKHEGTNKCQTFFLRQYKLQLSGTVQHCHSPQVCRERMRVCFWLCVARTRCLRAHSLLLCTVLRLLKYLC